MSLLAVGASGNGPVEALQAAAKPAPTPPAQNVGAVKPDSVEISEQAKQLSQSLLT